MNYLMTPEQKDLIKMIEEFAQNEVAPISKQYDLSGEFPLEVFKMAADMGLTMMQIPEQYGGLGQSTMTQVMMLETLAKADAGFSVAVGACGLATVPVLMAGTEEQKQKMADIMAAGGMAAFCLTEADAGSDAAALKTTAVEDGDDYIINGSKTFITNGGYADIYTVFATVDRSLGAKGITAFLVERDREGVSVGKEENKMGIRLSNTTDVMFQNVRIPKSNMLGKIGQGLKIALGTLDQTRATGSAAAVGICQQALDLSVKYAKERKTFGRPIIANQAIQFKLADMQIKTQTARWSASAPRRWTRASSTAPPPPWPRPMPATWPWRWPWRPSRSSAAMATAGSSRWRSCSATPRSSKSSRAPRRSSAWSSAAAWPEDKPWN